MYYVDSSNHLIIQRIQPLHAESSVDNNPPAREDVLSGLTAISFNPFRAKGDASERKHRLVDDKSCPKRAQLDYPVRAGELLPWPCTKGLRVVVFQDHVRGCVWSDNELLVRLGTGLASYTC